MFLLLLSNIVELVVVVCVIRLLHLGAPWGRGERTMKNGQKSAQLVQGVVGHDRRTKSSKQYKTINHLSTKIYKGQFEYVEWYEYVDNFDRDLHHPRCVFLTNLQPICKSMTGFSQTGDISSQSTWRLEKPSREGVLFSSHIISSFIQFHTFSPWFTSKASKCETLLALRWASKLSLQNMLLSDPVQRRALGKESSMHILSSSQRAPAMNKPLM